MPYHARFEIDIVSALAEQLVASFEKLDIGSLGVKELSEVDTDQGVYQLFQNNLLVYVGKADNLRKRLTEHRFKISGRRNISPDEMGFKCLYVHKNWTALAPEDSLIKHYKKQPGLCEWNGNGFGPHDPGRNREMTDKDPDGFDAMYPIKDDWGCDWIEPQEWNVRELLLSMKANLPYLLRFQVADKNRYRRGHPHYNDVTVTVQRTGMPARELLRLVASHLDGWQATVFPSHMILYEETHVYKHGETIWPE